MKDKSRADSVTTGGKSGALPRLGRFLLASALVVGCGVGSPSRDESEDSVAHVTSAVVGAASLVRGSVQLSAAKLYSPVRSDDAHIELDGAFTFRLPTELPVSAGNAGNGSAVLSVSGGTSGAISCTYQGGSSVAHPTTPAEIANGLRYTLASCTGGATGGASLAARTFDLRVTQGDEQHALGLTAVGVVLSPPSTTTTPGLPVQIPARPFPEFVTSSSAGSLQGSSQITVNGEFQYSIPVPVPPGRAGLQPNLALSYSSRGGDGTLGVGWRLSGIPSIRPCPATIATDGYTDGVHFDDNDRYCLDGAKLVAIQGAYGADQTEYRTEEDSFSRIVSSVDYGTTPPSRSFTVWTKDGRKLEFADVDAYRYEYTGTRDNPMSPSTQIRTYTWALTQVSDRAGNLLKFRYTLGDNKPYLPDINELLPTEIIYVDDSPANEVERKVSFVYEQRPDTGAEWISGIKLTRSKRLIRIATSVGGTSVAELRVGYAQSTVTGRSLLSSVRRCDGAQGGGSIACLQPREFHWDANETPSRIPWTVVSDAPTPDIGSLLTYNGSRVMVADFDGDGRDDALYQVPTGTFTYQERLRYSTGTAFGPPQAPSVPFGNWDMAVVRPIETHGDGRARVLAGGLDNGKYVMQLMRVERGNNVLVREGPLFNTISETGGKILTRMDFGDADGDGLADIFSGDALVPGVNGGNVLFWRNLGGSYAAPVDSGSEFCTPGTPRVVDPVANGRAVWFVSVCPGLGAKAIQLDHAGDLFTTSENVNVSIGSETNNSFVFADLNGDGLKDIVYPRAPTVLIQWNTGHGFTPDQAFPTQNVEVLGHETGQVEWDHGVRVADINGDGKDDLVKFFATTTLRGIWVFESTGTEFRSYKATSDPGKPDSTYGWVTGNVGDVDGDGLPDLITVTNQPTGMLRTLLNTNLRPDLLTYITEDMAEVDRHARAERVVYDTKWNAEGAETYSHPYPQRSIKRGLTVVRRHLDYPIGDAGPANETYYSYSDPRGDMLGRGFLGFVEQHIDDRARGTYSTLTFDLNTRDGTIYPYAGRPVRVVEVLSDSSAAYYNRVKTTSQAYRVVHNAQAAAVHSVLPVSRETTIDESSSATTTRVRREVVAQEWDSYGNETMRSDVVDGADSSVVRTAYEHDSPSSGTFFRDAWLITLPRTQTTTSSYNGGRALTRTTNYTHGSTMGELQTVEVEPGADPSVRLKTRFEYYRGLVTLVEVTSSDAVRRTTIAYDSDSVFPRWITNALGQSRRMFVDPALGVTTHSIDENGVSTWYQYDGFGRIRAEKDEGGSTMSRIYSESDSATLMILTAKSDGPEEVEFYDARNVLKGAATQMFDGSWASTTQSVDLLGRTTSVTRPVVTAVRPEEPRYSTDRTTISYDRLNRPLQVRTPDSNSIFFAYQARHTTTTDEAGHPVSSETDPNGRILRRYETLSGLGPRATSFAWGPFGMLDAINHQHQPGQSFVYDVLGRRTQLTDPDAGVRSFKYNAFGEIIEERDATGAIVSYQRDVLGRITSRTDAQGTSLYVWDTAPNGIGKLAGSRSPDGVLARLAYDFAGRLERKVTSIDGTDYSAAYEYDAQGRLSEERYPVRGTPFSVKYEYNAVGYLARAISGRTGEVYVETLGRNADGGVTSARLSNGLLEQSEYDALTGRIAGENIFKNTSAGGETLWVQGYTYDVRGFLSNRTEYSGSFPSLVNYFVETFEYDDARRLKRNRIDKLVGAANTTIGDITYSYDLKGNLIGARDSLRRIADAFTFSTSQPHQISSVNVPGSTEVAYDANGRMYANSNQWSCSDPPCKYSRTIQYNSYDLPRSVTTGVTEQWILQWDRRTTLRYDAFGVRTGMRSVRSSTQESTEASRIYVGDAYEEERAGPPQNLIKQYAFIRGPDGFAAEITFDAAGNEIGKRYLHHDRLGSTRFITTSSGVRQANAYYEPYGARRDAAGFRADPQDYDPPSRPEYGFTGHRHDDGDSLINMQGRVYDPILQRFLTPDPVTVHAVGSYSLRGAMTSSDPLDWLASDFEPLASNAYSGSPLTRLLGRVSSAAEGQGAPGGMSAGVSDVTTYRGPGLVGPGASFGSASRRPGAPAAVGPSFGAPSLSDSLEAFNPYAYTGNNPTNFIDPDGYNTVIINDIGLFKPSTVAAIFSRAAAHAEAARQQWGAGNYGHAAVSAYLAQATFQAGVGAKLLVRHRPSPAELSMSMIPLAGVEAGVAEAGAEVAAEELAGEVVADAVPKTPKGPGAVPAAERDPKRLFSPTERAEKLAEQEGKCAQCGQPKTTSETQGHHVKRHADGGQTTPDNHVEVCKECHKEVHR